MSPEQAHGLDLDPRTDLFSFGAVLYEMTTRQPAFTGRTTISTFDAILNKAPVSLVRLNTEVPAKLEEIIIKALDKDRETRYQSAAEVRADLRRLKRDSESLRVTVPSIGTRVSSHRWGISIAIAASIVVLMGVLALIPTIRNLNHPPAAGVRHLTQLFSSPDEIVEPALSPDGKTIVYAQYDQGQWDLFITRTVGSGRIRITNDAAIEWAPQFSPDGEKILFTRSLPDSDAPEICITSPFGGEITPLMTAAANAVWSPDGLQVAFISLESGKPRTVNIADVNTHNVRTVMQADSVYTGFERIAWSPDASQLAVVRSHGGVTGEIWTVRTNGGAPRQLSQDPPAVSSHSPVFSNDGRSILHSSNRGGATNLWLLPLDGTKPVQITNGAGPDANPSIARDGTISFINARFRTGLFIYDLLTKKSRELLGHSFYLWAPVFSPDGKDVAFSRFEADGSWHTWTMPVNGGAAQRLTSGSVPEIYPRFTQDGKWVIYFTWAHPNRVWKVPRAGGVPVPITPARNEDDAYADVSPDDKWLAFARTEGDMTRVYISPLHGGEARRLTQSSSTVPRWSPDGKRVAFSPGRDYDAGVFVISADGSGERRLTETGSWPVWSPDGKNIFYLTVGQDLNEHVRVVSVENPNSNSALDLQFNGSNYPIDLFSRNLLTTTNSVHLNSELWVLSPGR
jgi:Tol biopolymer transport system component